VTELRRALRSRGNLSLASTFVTAFGLHAACIGAQIEACAREDIPLLAAAYGPAEIDKAILDALRGTGPTFEGMAANIAGVDARLSRDLGDEDVSRFLPAASGWTRRDPAHGRHGRQIEGEAVPLTKRKRRRALFRSSSTAIPARCGAPIRSPRTRHAAL
jgi:hypothetical protein